MYNVSWARVGKVALLLLGLMPYIALSFGVVLFWDRYIGFVPLQRVGFWEYTTQSVLSSHNVFCSLSLLGSWTSWYLFCKLCKYAVWTH